MSHTIVGGFFSQVQLLIFNYFGHFCLWWLVYEIYVDCHHVVFVAELIYGRATWRIIIYIFFCFMTCKSSWGNTSWFLKLLVKILFKELLNQIIWYRSRMCFFHLLSRSYWPCITSFNLSYFCVSMYMSFFDFKWLWQFYLQVLYCFVFK